MSVKKVLLTISAMALIAVIAVAGTLAYLKTNTGNVTNTFTASSGIIDSDNFTLDESQIGKRNADGSYGFADPVVKVKENEYKDILAGATLAKDPTIHITNLKENAYLYFVVDNDEIAGLDFKFDDKWSKISDALLNGNAANVYVYADALDAGTTEDYNIILNQTVTVKADAPTGTNNMTFTAYLVQTTGFSNATEAWTSTYGANA